MKKKIIVVLLLIVMVLSMTACGEDPVENAVTPMNSVTEQVNEPGIYAYASSLKTDYKNASLKGDFGSYQFTLMTDSTPVFFQAPWWVDEGEEKLTADIVIIAGHPGTSYTGYIACYKCDYSNSVNGIIGEKVTSDSFFCDCHYRTNKEGMEKYLTITVIPIA